MEIKDSLKLNIQQALKELGVEAKLDDIVVESSKDVAHGDYATNVALKYSRVFQKSPRDVATLIIEKLDKSNIEKVEIAGPGFINIFLSKSSMAEVIEKIITLDENYGRGENKNKKINIEFVSANPTGDLHVGHARGAAIGDSIARILEFNGYEVTREYYINDAGNQIDHLGESLQERYKELLGLDFKMPDDGYHGEDVKNIAKIMVEEKGDSLINDPNAMSYFKTRGMELELDKIKQDLKEYRVTFDIYSSELKIRSNHAVEKEIEFLSKYTYDEEGAVVLKTTDFLDDKDRVIVKGNGDYTYFLPDIVYHINKLSRGYDQLIDVLGADHHGYINRMKSALMMHGYSSDVLEIELIQMVRMMKNGEEFKLSKRTGNGYTLRELCEDVGTDAARYFFVMRAASGHLDFDLDLAVKKSSDNPVYYAQYAHARLASVLDSAKEIAIDIKGSKIEKQSEINLLKLLSSFGDVALSAGKERAPYKITNYIHDVAEAVHAFYTECRVIDMNNIEVTASRLGLCKAARIVLRNALSLVGVSAPERM